MELEDILTLGESTLNLLEQSSTGDEISENLPENNYANWIRERFRGIPNAPQDLDQLEQNQARMGFYGEQLRDIDLEGIAGRLQNPVEYDENGLKCLIENFSPEFTRIKATQKALGSEEGYGIAVRVIASRPRDGDDERTTRLRRIYNEGLLKETPERLKYLANENLKAKTEALKVLRTESPVPEGSDNETAYDAEKTRAYVGNLFSNREIAYATAGKLMKNYSILKNRESQQEE
jgi:hypothetical protein